MNNTSETGANKVNQIWQSRQDCLDYWAAHPSEWAWCLHHEMLIEPLRYPISERISFIYTSKAKEEQECRFNNLRPILSTLPEEVLNAGNIMRNNSRLYTKASQENVMSLKELSDLWIAYEISITNFKLQVKKHKVELNRLHLIDVPNHTWNGKSIFKD